MTTAYSEIVARFAKQDAVTIACGTTCAYLGDERNLREFLIADETARLLRRAGHTVVFYLIDDSLDGLTMGQLRVAVNKNARLIEQYQHWCGRPIAFLPDPWGCCESYAAHFEEELLSRLHYLDCHPTLVRSAKLYERGVYAPYINTVLERADEIVQFLAERFPTYRPEKLFWTICPRCGYIDQTQIQRIADRTVWCFCGRCNTVSEIGFDELQGKLNWKLDCAVRWNILAIDGEAFSKAYLEPQTGAHAVARALSQAFFGGHIAQPIPYGLIKMENKFSIKLLDSLPRATLRTMLAEHPMTEFKLTRDLVVTVASRSEALPQLSYLDFVKQVLPIWLLTPNALNREQRELAAHGVSFSKHFLDSEVRLQLPQREQIDGEQPLVLEALHRLLLEVLSLRATSGASWEAFDPAARMLIDGLGERRRATLRRLRTIIGQEQGLPVRRLLFLLPLEYLQLLGYVLELHLRSQVVQSKEAAAA
jgi:hypothetical protein